MVSKSLKKRTPNKVFAIAGGDGFTEKLSVNMIKEMLSILEYSNFSELPQQYNFSCTDQPTTTLTIKYNNGQIKTIHDYGSFGNFTLAEIYKTTNKISWTPQ